jgi:cytoskeletal protein CcmA (bactofilin family)
VFKKKSTTIRTLIGAGTVIVGELRFTEGLRIDGEIQGDVVSLAEHSSLLVISEQAKITGRVQAGHIIINGTVVGPVQSNELLELQPKASIEGDVRYQSLEIHQGASINGELRPLVLNPVVNHVVDAISDEKPSLVKLAASNSV